MRELYGIQALSSDNVAQVMARLTDMCEAGEFYKQILAARFQFYSIAALDDWFLAAETRGAPVEIAQERGILAQQSLQHLHDDLQSYTEQVKMKYGVLAFLPWESKNAEECKKSCVTPSCTLCASFEGKEWCIDMERRKLVDRAEIDAMHDHATAVVSPARGYVTNIDESSKLICMVVDDPTIRPMRGPVDYRPCHEVESKTRFHWYGQDL